MADEFDIQMVKECQGPFHIKICAGVKLLVRLHFLLGAKSNSTTCEKNVSFNIIKEIYTRVECWRGMSDNLYIDHLLFIVFEIDKGNDLVLTERFDKMSIFCQ